MSGTRYYGPIQDRYTDLRAMLRRDLDDIAGVFLEGAYPLSTWHRDEIIYAIMSHEFGPDWRTRRSSEVTP